MYFLLVFAVGWILGPIRELWAVPHFGRMAAMLGEAVIMLIAMIVAAQWVIRRFDVPRTLGTTLSIGLIAIGLLFPAEIAGVVWVRGLSLQEYIASFVTAPGVISLVMFMLFAVMPTLSTLSTRRRVGAISLTHAPCLVGVKSGSAMYYFPDTPRGWETRNKRRRK
jgi:hypothetical protein